jgi:hypothetical protein
MKPFFVAIKQRVHGYKYLLKEVELYTVAQQ